MVTVFTVFTIILNGFYNGSQWLLQFLQSPQHSRNARVIRRRSLGERCLPMAHTSWKMLTQRPRLDCTFACANTRSMKTQALHTQQLANVTKTHQTRQIAVVHSGICEKNAHRPTDATKNTQPRFPQINVEVLPEDAM